MIHSMTGYGDATTSRDAVVYSLEVRALNNKYFKCTVRAPEELAGIEAELEAQARKELARGSLLITVKRTQSEEQLASRINDAALLTYVEHLETIRSRVQGGHGDPSLNIDLTQLLTLPGVLQPPQPADAVLKTAREVLSNLLTQALANVRAMRVTEGEAIRQDLEQQLNVVQRITSEVKERAPRVVDEYHTRLQSRVAELLAKARLDVEKNDLLREVAVYAERSDVAEEIQRLGGHVTQFREVLADDTPSPAGRTLDFLSQEMLREANTIGSKSNDTTIARGVVELKSAIDRIKEQVQNVE